MQTELKKHISFYVPVTLHRLVADVAAAERRPMSDVVRELIDPEQLRRRLQAQRESDDSDDSGQHV